MNNRYFFPQSYATSTHLFNGMVDLRHAIDAGVLALIGFILCRILRLSNISAYILICVPLALLGLHGILGDSVSTTIFNAIRWKRNKTPFLYANHNRAYDFSIFDIYSERKSLRDRASEMYLNYKKKHEAADLTYTAGVDFTFAEDPDQETLKFEYKRRIRLEGQQSGADDTKAQTTDTDAENTNVDSAAIERPTDGSLDSIDILGAVDHLDLPNITVTKGDSDHGEEENQNQR